MKCAGDDGVMGGREALLPCAMRLCVHQFVRLGGRVGGWAPAGRGLQAQGGALAAWGELLRPPPARLTRSTRRKAGHYRLHNKGTARWLAPPGAYVGGWAPRFRVGACRFVELGPH